MTARFMSGTPYAALEAELPEDMEAALEIAENLEQEIVRRRDEEEDDGWDDLPAEEKMHQDQEGRFMLRLHR